MKSAAADSLKKPLRNSSFRVVVIVSSDISDIYFANQLLENVNVVGVVIADTVQKVEFKPFIRDLSNPLRLVKKIMEICLQRAYALKAKGIALKSLGRGNLRINSKNNIRLIKVKHGESLNDNFYVEKIKELDPDVIAVCGAPIIKDALLSIPPKGVINLHGGLSQRYRGLWVTMWAIYNEEPEWVGYTVHYISKGIDDGNVLTQGRPEIEASDNHETLYAKVVKLGTTELIKAIQNIIMAKYNSIPLLEKGKLYKSSEVTPWILNKTWHKINKGLIRNYVENPKQVNLIK